MEGEGGVDASSVNKNPRIIKAAQDEVAALDVLVCGTCHFVFHFIESFQEHKDANECGKPAFKANLSESKPQVWAFLLWKSSVMSQHKAEGEKEPINSWKLYQRWCKMAENARESWIAAGKSIMTFSTLANAKIAEVHSHKAPTETKPRIVTTKSMPLTDDEDEEYKSEEMSGNDTEIKPEQRKIIRKVVRIPVEKNGSIKDVRSIRGQNVKEIRTYAPKKENLSEITITKAEVAESLPTVTDDVPEEKSVSAESVEKDVKEPIEETKEAEKPEEEKATETVQVEGEDTSSAKVEEPNLVQNPLGDGMVEIKVENMSGDEDHVEAGQGDTAEGMKLRVRVSPAPPPQRPGTVKRKLLPDSKSPGNRAIRRGGEKSKDGEASSEDEYVVEKILAKRFNPKRKYYEYLLKWEGYPHDQNTWEPVENMAACDKLVETFERNLARQKLMQQRAANQILQQQKLSSALIQQKSLIKLVKTTPKSEELNQPGPSGVNLEGRPVRSSKKRAMEQVKNWCGSMTKKEFETGKRKAGEESDSDDDMPTDKKIKLEPPDDDWSGGEMGTSLNSAGSSDDDSTEKKRPKQNLISIQGNQNKVLGIVHKAVNKMPTIQLGEEIIRRGPGRPPKRLQSLDSSNTINGITKNKTSSPGERDLAVELGLASDSSPEHKSKPQSPIKPSTQPPVLVANSKGVIKVDPRQVPNLTSGVYIVSSKSGIVKLNDLPSSPMKGNMSTIKPSPQGQKVGSGAVSITKSESNIQSGIVRKPLSQASTVVRPVLGQTSMKTGTALKSPLNINSGLVRVTPQGNLNKSLTGLSHLGEKKLPLISPRILGPRPSLGSPRPLSMLTQRPGLMHSSLRPGFQPRLPGMSLRPSLGSPGIKRPLGIPGIQTKITSALRPKTPLQSPLGRGLIRNPSPAAQVKSGMKPIHAMLGRAIQNYGSSPTLTTQQRLFLAKKQQAKETGVLIKQGSGGVLIPAASIGMKPGVKPDDMPVKKPLGRGRGKGPVTNEGVNNIGKQRDSKLVDSDGLHMEFHEVHSSSDSDDGVESLPELPIGDLPSLEPDSPPRPFTLCPETGKILGQAEGEPTPVPSPEPKPEPEAIPEPESVSKLEDEAEEILPDKPDGSPLRIAEEESSSYPNDEEDTLLKVEMSPGGTTGTVIESNVTDPTSYMDTLRTEEGLTVTKISTTSTSTNDTQQQVTVTTSKVGGGISVPARKLFLDSASNNSEGGSSSAGTGAGSSEMNTELVTITGEGGVVYQISTQGEQEGTSEAMLVSADGEQQCVYVTAEQAAGIEDGSVLTLDTAVAEAVAQLMPDQVNVIGGGSGCSQFYVKEGDGDGGQLMIASGMEQTEETTQAQVVAQVVEEGAGGTRRVVLLLPNGSFMMTEVDEEQYAALELDK